MHGSPIARQFRLTVLHRADRIGPGIGFGGGAVLLQMPTDAGSVRLSAAIPVCPAAATSRDPTQGDQAVRHGL